MRTSPRFYLPDPDLSIGNDRKYTQINNKEQIVNPPFVHIEKLLCTAKYSSNDSTILRVLPVSLVGEVPVENQDLIIVFITILDLWSRSTHH